MDKRAKDLRKLILKQIEGARRGHLASALSVIDIIRVLYDDVLRFSVKKINWAERDRFILSKGHGCLALYALLADKGFIPKEALDKFCNFEEMLGGHPEYGVPGIEFSTGSLGHGLSVGVGMAVALRVKVKPRVFVLLGDGECDEGSVWEAALSAGKNKLSNLTILIDYNKMQSFGTTYEVMNLEPFTDKWRAFGFSVAEADGHDVNELRKIFTKLPFEKDKPSTIICHTVKGKGIRLIENNPHWHHKSKISDEEIKLLYQSLDEYGSMV